MCALWWCGRCGRRPGHRLLLSRHWLCSRNSATGKFYVMNVGISGDEASVLLCKLVRREWKLCGVVWELAQDGVCVCVFMCVCVCLCVCVIIIIIIINGLLEWQS